MDTEEHKYSTSCYDNEEKHFNCLAVFPHVFKNLLLVCKGEIDHETSLFCSKIFVPISLCYLEWWRLGDTLWVSDRQMEGIGSWVIQEFASTRLLQSSEEFLPGNVSWQFIQLRHLLLGLIIHPGANCSSWSSRVVGGFGEISYGFKGSSLKFWVFES